MSPRLAISRLWAMPWTVALGVAIGLIAAPGGGMDWAWAAYDRWRPVVTMSGKVVDRGDYDVVVHIAGTKHRPCQFLAIRAYAEHDGRLVDINTERTDRPEDKHTKPLGTFSLGYWRAWPVKGATSVQWHVSHSCDGRLVTTKLAEVTL